MTSDSAFCAKLDKIIALTRSLPNARFDYSLLGPNSNSLIYSLLQKVDSQLPNSTQESFRQSVVGWRPASVVNMWLRTLNWRFENSALTVAVCTVSVLLLMAGCGPTKAEVELDRLLNVLNSSEGFSVACLMNNTLRIRDIKGSLFDVPIAQNDSLIAFRVHRQSLLYFATSSDLLQVTEHGIRTDKITGTHEWIKAFDVNLATGHLAYLSRLSTPRDVLRLTIAKLQAPSVALCSLDAATRDFAEHGEGTGWRYKSISWVGDKPELVYSDGRNIFWVNLQCEQKMLGLEGDAIAIDPKGVQMAYRSIGDHLVVGVIQKSGLRVIWKDRRRLLTEPRWSANSRFLSMTVGGNGVFVSNQVIIRDMKTGQEKAMRPFLRSEIRSWNDGAYEFVDRTKVQPH